MMNQIFPFILLLLFGFIINSQQQQEETLNNPDEVLQLPGLNFSINFRHYSGYLDAGDDNLLHYWFFESQNDPSKDPVVVWFNGGPGSSSLLGALTENGPFRINSRLQLELNEYSWNKRANVLYIESPAGVGYSYQNRADDEKNLTTNDDQVAQNNFQAIESFYLKYPKYYSNDFFITGESYGGIYIPTLSLLCLENKFPINFKGIAIGNPLLDYNLNDDSVLHYFFHHGMVNDIDWRNLKLTCCPNQESSMDNCPFHLGKRTICADKIKNIISLQDKLNPYNIYESSLNRSQSSTSLLASKSSVKLKLKIKLKIDPKKSFITSLLTENYNKNLEKTYPIITKRSSLAEWLNKNDVRKQLHISDLCGEWHLHGKVVQETYQSIYKTMKPQILKILKSNIKILMYFGDFDSVCNYLGGRWFIESLGLEPTDDYTTWELDGQMAGWQIEYGNLLYKTVMAAGHMVPTDQPEVSLKLFHDFLDSCKNLP